MAENGDLTPEQTEKLLQFQDLTGIEDMERCKTILGQHNWDIEVAVQARFSEQEGMESVFNQTRREPRTPPVDTHPLNQRIYTVMRPRPRGWIQWGYFVVMFPFRFVCTTVLDLLRFAYNLLRPDPRRYVTDPVGDVTAFIRQFEAAYGNDHPTFFQGSYSEALNAAKRELKFLLVYLHGDNHQDTPNFCRSTLCSPAVVEFVNGSVLFWACNTNSPEGYRVSQALRENTYPFFALISLRQNRMTVVARIEGPIEPVDLVSRLSKLMEDNEGSLVAARLERQERDFNQSLRLEQDEAYQQSLRADQEKERRRLEEQREREQAEEEERRLEREAQDKVQQVALRKERIREHMPQEPDADEPDAIRIVLKLPNGTRLERRFLKTLSVQHLYDYVFVHEAAPDDFQIVTNFPRRLLPCPSASGVSGSRGSAAGGQGAPAEDGGNEAGEDGAPTLSQLGLGKSEMLFVHDNQA